MDEDVDGLTSLDGAVRSLEGSLSAAQAMAAAFDGELGRMRESFALSGREAASLAGAIGRGVRSAFDGVVFEGERLSDALEGLGRSILSATYATAVRPVQGAVGTAIADGIEGLIAGILPFAQGGAFAQGRVMPFARGGIVRGPVSFPMRGGRGLMGEAGPEAIVPLARGADGRLGVRMEGGGRAAPVVINVTTPDVEGFRRSQGQIAAQAARALARGQRNR